MPTLTIVLQGQATDIMIHAQEIVKMKRQLNDLYVKHTKQPIAVIGTLFMQILSCFSETIRLLFSALVVLVR